MSTQTTAKQEKKEGIIDFRKNHFVLMDAENK